MKVYITSTPEFPQSTLSDVVEILNRVTGYLEFEIVEPYALDEISIINSKFSSPDEIEFLTFDELFWLCKNIRLKRIPKEAYLVLITNINNNKNWFSAFREKNIFIHGRDWQYYTKHDDKYGIAYQVVENIFQSQIELDINDVDNEPNIHMPSIGCINDMCMEKVDVMLKLRTAYICDSCIDRAHGKKVHLLLLQHIKELIEGIRTEFVNYHRITTKVKPHTVHVTSDRTIKIGNKEFDTMPIQKVLFIFFLKNNQGVETKLICDYQDELFDIYHEVRKTGVKSTIKNMFDKKKIGDPSFASNKSKLNKAIIKMLGQSLADFYIITNVIIEDGTHIYKIGLEDKYIKIDPKE